MDELSLSFEGPYTWPGYECKAMMPFEAINRHSKGVYLWTFEYADGFLVYAAGITRRSFHQRFKEHTKAYLEGVYTIFDMDKMAEGLKVKIWPGFWMKKRSAEAEIEFSRRRHEIRGAVERQLVKYRIFIAEVDDLPRILERMEAAIMDCLYSAPEPFSNIPDRGMKLAPRWKNEEPITVPIHAGSKLYGLPDKVIA